MGLKRQRLFMSAAKWIFVSFAFTNLVRADQVAFFYALDADLQALKTHTGSIGKTMRVGSRLIQIFEINTHRVCAVKMGSGAVETAASAQALLAKTQCDIAISLGPIGGISDSLKVGTWCLITNVVCYQKGSWTKNGFTMSVPPRVGGYDGTLPQLFRTAKPINVASGEIFVASSTYREQLRENTGAQAVDMNLFGLLTVCNDHRLPLVSWRVVSDQANDDACNAFRAFVAKYDGSGGKAVAELITHLPANTNSPAAYPNLQRALK